MPNGYPVKASVSFGLYYPPGSALYHDTLAELWFASEEVAQVNGFIRRIDSLHADQHQTLRITVTTLPSTVASLPGMGSKAGLCGINHT